MMMKILIIIVLLMKIWRTVASIRGQRFSDDEYRKRNAAGNEQHRHLQQEEGGFWKWFHSTLFLSSDDPYKSTVCDYDDPIRIRYCPPILSFSSSTDNPDTMEQESMSPLPSKCLENPDDPDCQQHLQLMQQLRFPPSDFVRTEKSLFRSQYSSMVMNDDFPVLATSAPTKDMCYGNMARLNKKFCHSEMPSASPAPSPQPTHFPNGDSSGQHSSEQNVPTSAPHVRVPTLSPSTTTLRTSIPSMVPTISTSPTPDRVEDGSFDEASAGYPLGPCQGDCNSDQDCEDGLFCYQRDANDPVPGCPGLETDSSRTDYCTSVAPVAAPIRPPTGDSFRLEMYWEQGYMWQEQPTRWDWCMACNHQQASPTPCYEGDSLFLHECAWNSAYFDFVQVHDNVFDSSTRLIQVVDGSFNSTTTNPNLCLERVHSSTSITLKRCDRTNTYQQWTVVIEEAADHSPRFEIVQNFNSVPYCITTHHHPKYGEVAELYPCSVARKDTTSYWNCV